MPQDRKRLDIQVLRAISVIGVVVFHLNVDWLPGGYLGVDIFFVLSGFLITGIFLRSPSDFSILNFYKRRIVRLFPALLVMLLVVLVFAVLVMQPGDFLETIRAMVYSALQCGNLYFIQGAGYFDVGHENSPLLHTWSLGVEEQFYLVWAPVFFWFTRRKIKITHAIIGQGVISLMLDLCIKQSMPLMHFIYLLQDLGN